MKWFRFYSEALDDPKVQNLPIAARWHWLEMLCVANSSEPRGRLHADRRLAARCNLTVSRLHALCKQLVSAGLLDEDGDYLIPHGWNKRQMQSDDVAERVRRHRESNVTVTALDPDLDPDPDTESETETESSPPPLALVAGQTDMGEVFRFYEDTFGSLNANVKDRVEDAVERYSGNWVREALKESAAFGARSWNYTEKILKGWEQDEAAETG